MQCKSNKHLKYVLFLYQDYQEWHFVKHFNFIFSLTVRQKL